MTVQYAQQHSSTLATTASYRLAAGYVHATYYLTLTYASIKNINGDAQIKDII